MSLVLGISFKGTAAFSFCMTGSRTTTPKIETMATIDREPTHSGQKEYQRTEHKDCQYLHAKQGYSYEAYFWWWNDWVDGADHPSKSLIRRIKSMLDFYCLEPTLGLK